MHRREYGLVITRRRFHWMPWFTKTTTRVVGRWLKTIREAREEAAREGTTDVQVVITFQRFNGPSAA